MCVYIIIIIIIIIIILLLLLLSLNGHFFMFSTKTFIIQIIIVRTRFESLAQKVDGLRPKKPKTMNL